MRSIFILCLLSIPSDAEASIFGEENVPLYKLVIGQITELERLAEAIKVAKEHRDMLREINEGIDRVTQQLHAIDDIVRRAKDLDPSSVRRLSDLTKLINDAQAISRDLDAVLEARLLLTQETIEKSALQSETAYGVGRELIESGARLSSESKTASPGRAAQLSAAASSAQMMAVGTLLQTLSHLTSLQAVSLEIKKSELESEKRAKDEQRRAAREFLKRNRK